MQVNTYLVKAWVKPELQQAKPNVAIDKWACPSIEIVSRMQQVTSAGPGIQLATCKPRYRLDRLQQR